MCGCDCAPPDSYNAADRRSRKPHRCSECRREIGVGEAYVEHSGKWDGRMATFRVCGHCAAATNIAAGQIEDSCVCFGHLRDDMVDHGHWSRPNRVLTRLLAGARRKWRHRRRRDAGKLMPVPEAPVRVAAAAPMEPASPCR